MELYNKKSKTQAIEDLMGESFKRITISFYRYVYITNPQDFRDELYREWDELDCFGRIYIAREGVNAQMSVPGSHLDLFLSRLQDHPEFDSIPIKYAVEDDGKSFYKLTVKVRPKIVADGLDDHAYDVTDVGKHLSPLEFHELSELKETLVIDMRNHYESEVGRFKGAFCPDADTFRDAIKMVVEEFKEKKDQKVLLYCTGGIRCEKASAYFKHNGFGDVNQLHGGIIAYAHEIKKTGQASHFIGKNFVFDQRLGESIDGQIISRCHQCGAPCDSHTNCANDACHLLFLQCERCSAQYEGCCSDTCKEVISLPPDEIKKRGGIQKKHHSREPVYKSRLRPHFTA